MSERKLKRVIGTWALSLNLVNIIIGAGIFMLPAVVAEGLGAASIVAYLFCAVLFTLVMLCFAEVGSYIEESGGAYAYIKQAFGDYFGFITAVIFVVAVVTANAAVANAIADILGSLIPWFHGFGLRSIFFFLLFAVLAIINVKGIKQGIGFVKFITIAKLLPLLLLVLIGFSELNPDYLIWDENPKVKDLGKMALVLFFAFQGAEAGLTLGGEVKNPRKTFPRAILIGILIVLFVYLLIQTVAQGVLGDDLIKFQDNPLGEVAKVLIGPLGITIVSIGAAVSMLGNIGGTILSIPRVLYRSARDKVVPIPLFALIHKKYATPYVSIIAYATLGFLLAISGGFKELAILASSSILLMYLGVALSVIKLRSKYKQEGSNHFIIPGGYLIPVLASITIVWFLSNMSKQEFLSIAGFLILISVTYLLIKRIKVGGK